MTIETKKERTTLPETADWDNSLRTDIRTAIRAAVKSGKLSPASPVAILRPTEMNAVTTYLGHSTVSEGDTRKARISRLRYLTEVFVVGKAPYNYTGDADPDKGLPYKYRLTFIESTDPLEIGYILVLIIVE